MKKFFLFIFSSMLIPLFALANGGGGNEADETFVEHFFSYDPLAVLGIISVAISAVVIVILLNKPKEEKSKIFFFVLLTLLVVTGTFYIAGGTFYKIYISPTKGPVHWHADYRIINCGEELDLIDPKGLSSKIGSSVVHEHGDNRLHIEGIIADLSEGSLGGFMDQIGGRLTNEELIFPTEHGKVSMKSGELCPDGSAGELQLFLWKTEEGVASQEKIEDIPGYIPSPYELVPPGDCLILEFDKEKEKTEYLCEQYEVAENNGDLKIIR